MTDSGTDNSCSNWKERGHPSYVWRSGQDRRLALIQKYVELRGKRILDVGCGVGAYVKRFAQFSDMVVGVDVEFERVNRCDGTCADYVTAESENLPFATGSFDIVFLNEVIEHVKDDYQTIAESIRVLSPGGHLIIYAPNRLYLFETHGIYFGKRYIFKLIPFVNYLPNFLRNRFCPHVRAYTAGSIRKLFKGLSVDITTHEYVYPGFDNIAARNRFLAKILRGGLYKAENTPVKRFGISHFLIAKKVV